MKDNKEFIKRARLMVPESNDRHYGSHFEMAGASVHLAGGARGEGLNSWGYSVYAGEKDGKEIMFIEIPGYRREYDRIGGIAACLENFLTYNEKRTIGGSYITMAMMTKKYTFQEGSYLKVSAGGGTLEMRYVYIRKPFSNEPGTWGLDTIIWKNGIVDERKTLTFMEAAEIISPLWSGLWNWAYAETKKN